MISNQILQNTIEGLKSIARVEFCVMDTDGKEVASTTDNMSAGGREAAEFARSPADSQEIQGQQYFKIFDEQQLEYVLIAAGAGEDSYMVGKMAAFQVQNLLIAYKERFDKDNFIKNLLLDNLLLIDIYSRAKKLHIQADVNRVVMIIETDNVRDSNVLEIMRTYFGSGGKDCDSGGREQRDRGQGSFGGRQREGDREGGGGHRELSEERGPGGRAHCLRHGGGRDQGGQPLLQGGQDGPGRGKDLF